jgi:hypothetical protein
MNHATQEAIKAAAVAFATDVLRALDTSVYALDDIYRARRIFQTNAQAIVASAGSPVMGLSAAQERALGLGASMEAPTVENHYGGTR